MGAKDANGLEDDSYSPSLSSSALERLQLHMQLQSLQKPFSFCNNPAMWPKLHPLQEKMIQSLQSLNGSPTPLWQYGLPSPQPGQGQKVDHFYEPPTNATVQEDFSNISNPKVNELQNPLHVIPPSGNSMAFINGNNPMDSTPVPKADGIEQSSAGIEVSGFQAELDDFLSNKSAAFVPQEDQMVEFDCFREMNSSKDNVIWWSNYFDAKSATSNPWDSTSVLQSEQMFQDYQLGYNL